MPHSQARTISGETIVSVIAKVENPDIRALAEVIYGLVQQINSVLSNDEALRETVLNGHAQNHGADHEWIKERRAQATLRAAIDAWAVRRMDDEATAAADKKEDRRVARHTLIREIVAAALGAGVMLAAVLMKLN